ncbi:hypothetical protein MtrunA17_Chr4g0053301 [Medicago truncatula]|uniref:Uncharacterized protein n=1 Tax=Medicago truncatula TaxID=3880 RepID=A0A396IBI6_MEDTR|nr:hypothetical protein MtrunA17_Chr5g0413471 [Medicago truncatula]RHN62976.1 hypothetical protein MtrunA17_Chr4g0053301 [Medicago truncatula]
MTLKFGFSAFLFLHIRINRTAKPCFDQPVTRRNRTIKWTEMGSNL